MDVDEFHKAKMLMAIILSQHQGSCTAQQLIAEECLRLFFLVRPQDEITKFHPGNEETR